MSKERFPLAVMNMTKIKSLTKVKPVSVRQDEKPLTIDRECISETPLRIGRQRFSRGFGCHAKSEIVFQLPEKEAWKMFTARCGIDNKGNSMGTVAFKIYADGKLVADSGKVTQADGAVPIWADVTGVKELKLVVDDCGDGIFGDIADWVDPVLRK